MGKCINRALFKHLGLFLVKNALTRTWFNYDIPKGHIP